MTRRRPPKPRLAVWKFASCDGCQLSLLDCEDDLLTLADIVHIAHFAEASSDLHPGPYDLSLVEGSITTEHDAARIRTIREQSRALVTIGACATAGGIQALRGIGGADVAEFTRYVYPQPSYISTLATSTAISAHVPVDYELHGCPVHKDQLLQVIAAFAAGRRPRLPAHSVCVDCKLAGHTCVWVTHGTACLGPVTQTGCGALCPQFGRGCYGCFGPHAAANVPSLTQTLQRDLLVPPHALLRSLRTFNAASTPFAHASRQLELEIHSRQQPVDATDAQDRKPR